MLTQALQYKVVCGYVPNTTSARDIAAIVTRISKRSKGVFAAYEDLRVSAGEFSYPKYWGEREDDEVVEEDDNEDGDAPPGINKLGYAFHTPTGFFVPTAKQAFANDELLKKVWKGVKASGKEGNLLKQLGMGVIHGNNAAKASQAMKALIGGGGQFQFDEEAMKRKQKNLTALKPKVGLAALRLRPKLYRKFAKVRRTNERTSALREATGEQRPASIDLRFANIGLTNPNNMLLSGMLLPLTPLATLYERLTLSSELAGVDAEESARVLRRGAGRSERTETEETRRVTPNAARCLLVHAREPGAYHSRRQRDVQEGVADRPRDAPVHNAP